MYASAFPINRQLLRSSGVPCKSRGYQVRGTDIERPSFSSTVRLSAVIRMFCALTSALKELIPTPRQNLAVFFNEIQDTSDFAFAKASARLQSQRIKPKLRHVVIALNVTRCASSQSP